MQMKRMNLILIAVFLLAWTPSPSIAASNPLEKQILKLQPQADKNGDGKLSREEETALHKMILKRFPQADSDGDGVSVHQGTAGCDSSGDCQGQTARSTEVRRPRRMRRKDRSHPLMRM